VPRQLTFDPPRHGSAGSKVYGPRPAGEHSAQAERLGGETARTVQATRLALSGASFETIKTLRDVSPTSLDDHQVSFDVSPSRAKKGRSVEPAYSVLFHAPTPRVVVYMSTTAIASVYGHLRALGGHSGTSLK
jgi:hypothetical protein